MISSLPGAVSDLLFLCPKHFRMELIEPWIMLKEREREREREREEGRPPSPEEAGEEMAVG